MRLFLAIFAICVLVGCNAQGVGRGRGKKIGQIVHLSTEGRWCLTYEGELVRGGFRGGSGVSGSSFHFTLLSKEMFDQLQKVMDKQYEIEVDYLKATIQGGCAPSAKSEGYVIGYRVLDVEQRRKDLQKELEDLK